MDAILLKEILTKNSRIFGYLLVTAILGSAVISLFLRNEYNSYAYLVAPRSSLSSSSAQSVTTGGNLSIGRMLSLSSSSNSDPNIEYAINRALSFEFLSNFIVKNDLLPELLAFKSYNKANNSINYYKNAEDLKIENLFKDNPINYEAKIVQDAVKELRSKFRIYGDVESSIVTASFSYYTPQLSRDILSRLLAQLNQDIAMADAKNSERNVNYIAKAINTYPQPMISKTLGSVLESNLTKMVLAQSEVDYAFTTVDPPILPLKKSWPSRTFIVFSSFLTMVLFIIIATFVELQIMLHRKQKSK